MTRSREDGVPVGGLWLGQLGQDLRFGVRTLLRDRVFAVSAILTLGLATGATTAVFSLVNGLLLRPLPFPAAERLVSIHGRNWGEDRGTSPDPMTAPVGSLEIEALQHSRSFEAIAGYAASTRHLESSRGVERVRIVAADRAFFDVLKVGSIVGRTFRSDDPPSVAVVSERAWRQRFGGDLRVVERTVTLDGIAFSIVGVMPDSFEFPYHRANSSVASMPSDGRTEVWVPLPPLRAAAGEKPRGGRVEVVARLARKTTLQQASAELAVMAGQIEAEHYRGTPTRSGMRVAALVDDIIAPVRSSLWLPFAAVGLVLAAACANVAGLLLARMLRRAREVVTRAALGASGLRLVRQFLAESLLLSLAGGVVGAVIASWGTEALLAFYRGRLPRLHEVSLDWQAFVFLLLACTVAAGLVGMAPALAAARTNPHDATKTAGGHATMGRRTRLVRDGLVTVEVMLAFVLAVAVALVLREIDRLHNVPTGMSVENVVVLHLTPRTTPADYRAIEERVAAIAGAQAAGFIQYVPLQNSGWLATFQVRGRPASTAERLTTDLRYVTPGYFQAAGIPIVGGRNFTSGDTAGAPPVVLVNETFARRYFSNEDAVGRELDRGTIVGVVGDVRSAALGSAPEPELYYYVGQNLAMTDAGLSLVVRTAVPPETMIGELRSAVAAVNPKLAIFNVKTMRQIVSESLWQLALYRWLIGAFAAVAVTLAAIGLYAMIAYAASSRAREFAIRRALGSDRWRIVRLIYGRGLALCAVGIVGGIVSVLFMTWWLGDSTSGLRPDVATCVVVSLFFLVVAAVACAGPARRAATVNPIVALRYD